MSEDYPHALPAGCRLGDFRIDAVIGHGGFGITYRAADTVLGKTVAIKEYLPVEFAVRAEGETVRPRGPGMVEDFRWGLERFLDEARTLARFRHPNLVPVLRYFEGNGTGYMVMEHEAGPSLADRLARGGPLPESELRRLLEGLLDGLEEVHAAGYLHRDIKPANIIVARDGSPVLIDFGAARQALGAKGRTMTSIVTPRYAPLEQYALDGEQGPWSDIYGLAAVAFHAITGSPPPEAVARLRSDPYEALAPRFADRYDRRLLEAIDWGLAVHAEDRPRRIADWRRWMGGAEVDASAADGASPDEAATRKLDAPLTGLIARSAGGQRVEPRLGGSTRGPDSRNPLNAGQPQASPGPTLGSAAPADDSLRLDPPDDGPPSRRGERRASRIPRLWRIAIIASAAVLIVFAVRELRRPTPVAPPPEIAAQPQPAPPAAAEPSASPPAVEAPPSRPAPEPTPIRSPQPPKAATPPVVAPPKAAVPRAAVVEARQRAVEQAKAMQVRALEAEKEAQTRAARAAERAGEARIAAAEAARPDLPEAQRQTYADGVVYVGQMKDGKREGSGVADFPNGERQAGQWKDDRLDGVAVLTLRDGRRYEGEWDDGAPMGLGVLVEPGGRSEGEIKRGKQEGFAVRTVGGASEAGEWKNHFLHGLGVEAPPGGSRYEGEFRAGKRHGQGVLRLPGGETFYGAFADGKREGYGVETAADGTPLRSGIWAGDALVRAEE